MRSYISMTIILSLVWNIDSISARNPDHLFMIEHAVKAPSGHNTQPWLFKINERTIEIHPDYDKSLSVVDPLNRELFISLGCALENLCIAASTKGYLSDVHLDDEGIITVALHKKETPSVPDSLFDQIPLRQTNRRTFTGKVVPPEHINILEDEVSEYESVNVRVYSNGTEDFAMLRELVAEGNIIQMNDTGFKRELTYWMRYNKKHSVATRDGLSYDLFGAPNLPRFMSEPVIKGALNSRRQVKGDDKRIGSSSHLVLFSTRNNSVQDWIILGQVLQRFLLTATGLGISASFFNQPNEVPELSGKMVALLGIGEEYPAILLRIGYAEAMPYSKRKDIEKVILK